MATESQYITYQQARDLFATKEDLAKMEARLGRTMLQMALGLAGLNIMSIGVAVGIVRILSS